MYTLNKCLQDPVCLCTTSVTALVDRSQVGCRAPPVRPCSLGSVCEGGLRQESIFEITSTPRTGPRGSGAYATQPSCDLHTSAAAWLWLSPQHSSSSPVAAAPVLPRLSESHASVPNFFYFYYFFYFPTPLFKGIKGYFTFHGRRFIFFPMSSLISDKKGTELHSFWLVHFPPTPFFSSYFKLEVSQAQHRSTETKHRYQESTFVLQMPTAIEQLLSPFALTNTFLTAPSFPPPLPICSSVTHRATAEIVKSVSSSIRLH